MTTTQTQAHIDALAVQARRAEKEAAKVPERVKDARKADASWTEIGNALGVSRQAAWERYRKLDEEI
jgi:DNA-binding Lrp family transcriptional regulator